MYDVASHPYPFLFTLDSASTVSARYLAAISSTVAESFRNQFDELQATIGPIFVKWIKSELQMGSQMRSKKTGTHRKEISYRVDRKARISIVERSYQ